MSDLINSETRQKHDLFQLSLKGDEALAANRVEEALGIFAEILKWDAEDIPAAMKLAELEEKLGRSAAAAEHYSRLGETFLKNRLLKKAQEMLKKVTSLDPADTVARSKLAQIYLKQGSDNDAKKEFFNAAELALDQKDLDGALEYARMAVELKSIEAHYIVGVVLFERQKWAEAKEAFEYLLRFKLNHVGAFIHLGKIYAGTDQQAKAAESFQKALKLESGNLPALEAWAEFCVKRKNKDEAVKTLNLLVDRAAAENQWERAVEWARVLVSVDANLALSKLKLAQLLEKIEPPRGAANESQPARTEEAREHRLETLELHPAPEKVPTVVLEEAPPPVPAAVYPAEPSPKIEVNPQEAFKAQMDMADHYVKQALLDEAIDIYQLLLEENPEHPEVKAKLNQVYAAYAKTGTDVTAILRDGGEAEKEAKAREDAEKKMREEIEKKIREEEEKKVREDMEKRIREEVEMKVRAEIEKKNRDEAEKKIREEAEQRVRAEAEKRAREEAENRIRAEAERKIREEAEHKIRAETERSLRDEVETKIREEAQKKSLNEIQKKIQETVAKKTREQAEKKAREEAENKERSETERLVREEVERKVKDEMEKKIREQAEKRIRENVEKQVRAEAEMKLGEEVEKRTREELDKKDREDDKKKARDEAKRKIREVMGKKNEELGEAAAIAEADQHYSRGHHEQALRLYQRILESRPDHPEVLKKVSFVQGILNSKVISAPTPVLKVLESHPRSNPTDAENELDGRKKSKNIGYV